MRGALAGALSTISGIVALVLFILLFLVATILALVVPGLESRRAMVHALARLALPVLGIRLEVVGLERLPEGSCIVVSNHASYLDGIVMKAALPPRFSFVIKREASSTPILGFLLRRIGSEFVDRHNAGGRHRDASRLLRKAGRGHSLVFFPEGTFDGTPGLKRFLAGAFVAAARAELPVVPAVIHGARRALPNRAVIVRRGRIRVEILEPLPPPTASRHAVEEMRRDSRRSMLAHLEEPDLAPDQTAGHH
jgi:1-acyl-sn-glycerol-3-phosphate acyltransferase